MSPSAGGHVDGSSSARHMREGGKSELPNVSLDRDMYVLVYTFQELSNGIFPRIFLDSNLTSCVQNRCVAIQMSSGRSMIMFLVLCIPTSIDQYRIAFCRVSKLQISRIERISECISNLTDTWRPSEKTVCSRSSLFKRTK